MPHGDYGAIEANPCVLPRAIDLVVCEPRGDRILHGGPRKRIGNHCAHEKSGHGRVPVRKLNRRSPAPFALTPMLAASDVCERPHAGEGLQPHTVESRVSFGPSVQCWVRINAYAEQSFRTIVEEGNYRRVHPCHLQQEVLVADASQALLLLAVGEPGHAIRTHASVVESGDVPPRRGRHGRLRKPIRPRYPALPPSSSHDETIVAENLLGEEGSAAQTQRPVELAAREVRGGRSLEIDSDRCQQCSGYGAVMIYGLEIRRPPVEHQRAAVVCELVACGVAAEIVVIVQNQHARASTRRSQEEVRGREPAQATTHDHKVVALAGVGRGSPPLAVPERMSDFKGPRVASPHPCASGRIILPLLLQLGRPLKRRNPGRAEHGSRNGDAHAANEVTTADLAVQPKVTIPTH